MKYFACAIAVAALLAAGFMAGIMFVADGAYDAAKADMLAELRHEMRAAIADGRPFYIIGSNIRLIPRADGNINARRPAEAQIAGAGADVPTR